MLEKEVRQEERERTPDQNVPEWMKKRDHLCWTEGGHQVTKEEKNLVLTEFQRTVVTYLGPAPFSYSPLSLSHLSLPLPTSPYLSLPPHFPGAGGPRKQTVVVSCLYLPIAIHPSKSCWTSFISAGGKNRYLGAGRKLSKDDPRPENRKNKTKVLLYRPISLIRCVFVRPWSTLFISACSGTCTMRVSLSQSKLTSADVRAKTTRQHTLPWSWRTSSKLKEWRWLPL